MQIKGIKREDTILHPPRSTFVLTKIVYVFCVRIVETAAHSLKLRSTFSPHSNWHVKVVMSVKT